MADDGDLKHIGQEMLEFRLVGSGSEVAKDSVTPHQKAEDDFQDVRASRREAEVGTKEPRDGNTIYPPVFNEDESKPWIHRLNEAVPSQLLLAKKLVELGSFTANCA